jgi:uncharacterized protein YciI
MLRLDVFVVLTSADTTLDELAPVIPAHLDHQIELEKSGVLVAAGPWVDDDRRVSGGLTVLRADCVDDVDAVMAADPLVASGQFQYEVRKWRVNEGRLTFSLDLSDQTCRVT